MAGSLRAALTMLCLAGMQVNAAIPALTPNQYTDLTYTSPNGGTMKYSLYPPPNYVRGEKLPVLIHMHGTNPRTTWQHEGMPLEEYPISQFRFMLIEPYCPPTHACCWDEKGYGTGSHLLSTDPTPGIRMTRELALSVVEELTLDRDRIYLHGNSNGGYAIWDMILRWPDDFAAAIPVCGGGDPSKADRLANMPVWAFHCIDDDIVPFSGTEEMINGMFAAGSQPLYTYGMGCLHNAWYLFRERKVEVFQWMFKQVRDPSPPVQAPAGLTASKTLPKEVHLKWNSLPASADPQTGIWGYAVYRGTQRIAIVKDTVYVDASLKEGTGYAYTVAGLNGRWREGLRSSSLNASTLTDTDPPKILSALTLAGRTADTSQLMLVFDEVINPSGVATTANYSISNNVAVYSAKLNTDSSSVVLTTAAFSSAKTYTIEISGIQDKAQSPNTTTRITSDVDNLGAKALPVGLFKELLLLENAAGSYYLPHSVIDVLNPKVFVSAGAKRDSIISASGNSYTWRLHTSSTGSWASDFQDNFTTYSAITIYSPWQRNALLSVRHDDGLTAMANGKNVYQNALYDNGTAKHSIPFTLSKGSNHFSFRLHENSHGNSFSVQLLEENKTTLSHLYYHFNGGAWQPPVSTPDELVPARSSALLPRLTALPSGLRIHTGQSEDAAVEMFDMRGAKVFTQRVRPDTELFIDTGRLSKGAYMLRIHGGSETFVLRHILR